jgi:hypothetical protein
MNSAVYILCTVFHFPFTSGNLAFNNKKQTALIPVGSFTLIECLTYFMAFRIELNSNHRSTYGVRTIYCFSPHYFVDGCKNKQSVIVEVIA